MRRRASYQNVIDLYIYIDDRERKMITCDGAMIYEMDLVTGPRLPTKIPHRTPRHLRLALYPLHPDAG